MRLHALRITAFGPFTDTVEVDFDALSGAGLFLLSGATGSGKTSILDAVCFALYGDVPGDRATAKRLRSDRADPATGTEVVLEATLSGRRFRLTRTPAWERPKRRGTGTTLQQASVVVQEQRGQEWHTHTTRLDEAGQLVSGLLGMTLTQFVQVAMLPQGRFATFLRAGSEERKGLLQRLFRTERFTDVERWLRQHRAELRHRSAEYGDRVAEAVSRISESSGADLPADWDLSDLTLPAESGELSAWTEELHAGARAAQDESTALAATALSRHTAAKRAAAQARELVERHRRVRAAAEEHAALLDGQADHDLAVAALEDAHRAAPVTPLRLLAARAVEAHRTAVAQAPPDLDLDRVAEQLDTLTARLAEARAAEPARARWTAAIDERAALRDE
ncbi:MAG: SMC family ATPase, partial [Nocardioides sp.]|uniref:AAA family ATPase n=1 Tax=Nocardioides sp. TaxID=35761 RepID=UPI0039E2A91A